MRKHFLILMLLTLLPLAGWAADFATEAKVTVDDIYFGLKLDVSNDVLLKVNTNEITAIKLDADASGNPIYYTSEACDTKAPNASGAITPVPGTYYVKVLPTTSANSNWAAGKVIVKAMPLTVVVADASKVFNNKGAEDTAEQLGAITGITRLNEDGEAVSITGTALTALKNQMTVTRKDGKDVKDYAYEVAFAADNNNYEVGTVSGKFSITVATFPTTRGITGSTYSVVVSENEKVYNGENQSAKLTIRDNALGYTLVATDYTIKYDGNATAKNYKEGGYVISFTTKGNYAGSTITLNETNDKKLVIAKQPLKIYVNGVSKVYDGTTTIPATTFGYSGLVGADQGLEAPFGDIYEVKYVTENANNKNVNENGYQLQPVRIEGSEPEGNFNNYEIELRKTGLLTVTKRPLKITANNASKTFGAADPTFTFSLQALDNEKQEGIIAADLANVNAAYKVVRTNTVESVGKQTGVLMPTQKTDTEISSNANVRTAVKNTIAQYEITPVAGDFEITGATLTVYPEAQFITYGDEYDLANVNIVAVNSGGKKVTLTSTNAVKFKGDDQHPTDRGIYTLIVDGDVTADGYTVIEKLESQFTIKPKALTVEPLTQTLHVGDAKDALAQYNTDDSKVKFTGLVEGDKIKYELDFNTTDSTPIDGRIPTFGINAEGENAVNDYNALLPGAVAAGQETGETYTAEEAAEYNAALDGAVAEGEEVPEDFEEKVGEAAAGETLTADEAAAYNAELDGAVSEGNVKKYTAATAAAYNEALGVESVAEGDDKKYTAEEAVEYNAALDGAVAEGEEVPGDYEEKVGEPAEDETLTADEAILYNAELVGAVSEGDVKKYTAGEAADYNAELEGAVAEGAAVPEDYATKVGEEADGDVLTAAEAAAYNAELEGAVAAGNAKKYTADEAAAKNTETGAVVAGDPLRYTAATAAEKNATLEGAITDASDLQGINKGIDEEGKLLVAATYAKGIKIITDFDATDADDMADFDNNNYVIDWNATAELTVVEATTFVLDDTDADLAAKIEAANGAVNVTFTFSSRTLKAGQWNTLVLPFATTVPEISQKLGYAVVDVLNEDNTNESNVSLVLAFGDLPANKPFLVQPAEDKNLNTVTFANKTVEYSAEPVAEDAANHSLIGVYTMGKKVSSADKTEYYYNVTKKQFVNGGANGTAINPMRAYLKDNSSVGVRTFTIEEPNGQTTVITNVNTEAEFNTNEVYDIRGMKMQGVPTEKGIYIINGKKVVIK